MYLLHTNFNLGNSALSEQTLMIWVRCMIGLDHLELKNIYSLVVTEKTTLYGISGWLNLSNEPMYNHGNSVILPCQFWWSLLSSVLWSPSWRNRWVLSSYYKFPGTNPSENRYGLTFYQGSGKHHICPREQSTHLRKQNISLWLF